MRGRDVKIEVWSYSEGEDFPKRRRPFFRKCRKAILLACAALFLGATLLASIAAGKGDQPSFTEDSPYVYDGAHVLDSSVVGTLTELNETLESRSEGAQLYIVTIDSLPLGKTIEQYSIEQAERIGAGDSVAATSAAVVHRVAGSSTFRISTIDDRTGDSKWKATRIR